MSSIIEEVQHVPWLLSPLRKAIDVLSVSIERFSPDDDSSWDRICLDARSAYGHYLTTFTAFEGARDSHVVRLVGDSTHELWAKLQVARDTLPSESKHYKSVSAKMSDLISYAREKFDMQLT
jgi:hypothetical protein